MIDEGKIEREHLIVDGKCIHTATIRFGDHIFKHIEENPIAECDCDCASSWAAYKLGESVHGSQEFLEWLLDETERRFKKKPPAA